MPQRPIRSILGSQMPVTANGELTVQQAARLMKERRVGALLVMDAGRLAGIFTERDALFRVVAENLDPRHTPLERVMTRNPRIIDADKPFGYALLMMHEGGFRHVPVMEHGHPLGMVTARDALAPELEEFRAEMLHREQINQILG